MKLRFKRMKEEIAFEPQSRARFIFEAEITGNLEHPGIVPVYGKGEYADGRPYYAMRFIRGDNLKVAVDQFHKDEALQSDPGARQRAFQKLLRRFLVVCETISYAHSRGVIHRDLKPRNIMLGPYGETLVVDWGMAKVVGHKEEPEPSDLTLRPPSSSDIEPTQAGSKVGTPAYMSPEQARGEVDRLGPAADIYSLGATLYYMLTGKAPFTEQELPEMLFRVEHGKFPPPRDVKSGVDRALEAICLKAMALRPADRYASCRALADDLEHWLADQPVSAYPEPVVERALRWLRPRKKWVASAAAILVVALAGVVFHDWRLSQEAERLKQARDEASKQLGMTRAALRELLDVAAAQLAGEPGSANRRAQLAAVVLDMYKTLLESHPSDPDIRFELAQVYYLVAGIARLTGQLEESRSSYKNALDAVEAVARIPSHDKPAQAPGRQDLDRSW